MSKRLSKRQQREAEELEQLKLVSQPIPAKEVDVEEEEDDVEEEEEEQSAVGAAPVNAFAALGAGGDDEDEGVESEPEIQTTKKNKKNKKKKKKVNATTAAAISGESTPASQSTPSKKRAGKTDPFEGMDEIDRAVAELKIRHGEEATAEAGPSKGDKNENRSTMAFRNLLSVDPKNLDADAELRRFFGSKVIASSALSGGNKHRPTPSSKLRYTISKPKANYPPATSLAGLVMREMVDSEVEESYARRFRDRTDKSEKWFTFEHAGVWREVERQFLGAVRSHDPNQLMALLQVYPWHVDTLLQMSEVYRLQSDIGAASDYAERALYAFDRCLMPSFNVTSGASRLDFDRVENRPMFTALHRIISYLGRRGCWVTAFNFAKLLFSLDPEGDPHGAAFWLDFLAVKSGNGAWLLSMLEQGDTSPAAASWYAYPGMAYAKALALRADEESRKSKDHTKSNEALQEAISDFPQVVVPLADKIGASLPDKARSHPLLQIEAGYSDAPTNVMHLLSHIYVARNEALWKEASRIKWFETQLSIALSNIDNPDSKTARDDALALMQSPRDPIDESINVPLYICRHVLCSESTSWLGFLPPVITKRPFEAFDPLPPTTATSLYDNDYFNGLRSTRNSRQIGGGGEAEGGMTGFINRIFELVEGNPNNWQGRVMDAWRDMTNRREFQNVPQEERDNVLQMLMQLAGDVAQGGAGGQGGTTMPGGFPAADVEEE